MSPREAAHGAGVADRAARFASDVEYYLTLDPRQLPSRYLYDALGSALFEAICELPWYPLTRAEEQLLHAAAREIFEALRPSIILEMGSGSGEKLALLLDAAGDGWPLQQIHLVDISASALAQAERTINAVTAADIVRHEATYETGLARFAARRRGARALTLFLGSNIGNFDPPGSDAFLNQVRAALRLDDAFLLGTDLVKSERELLLAYDDPLGVTAAFNRNLLVRINRELDGNFDLASFEHRAIWNAAESRVEMHLVSRLRQRVRIAQAGLDLEMLPGETIWTESSYKFTPEAVVRLLTRNGFRVERQWLDERRGFALTLAVAA